MRATTKKALACVECDLCGNIPCVWKGEFANVVANDQLEHGNTFGIENKTRRRVACRYAGQLKIVLEAILWFETQDFGWGF
jgi:hypothetical protein